ncbi:uncharacterized protein [Chelonus insularis]|uniref:uncharacterized protein n=1 Tax=Chelonus insularis TaxID=460826 RepID=UPI001588E62C|nr:uncharacterized protein LOC118071277 [Chelonus insularis]
MEDKGLDMCESIWNYEAIQRFLSLLQQTQLYCIDNECFTADHLPGPNSNQLNRDYLFLGIALLAIILLYFFKSNFRHQDLKKNWKNNTNLLIFKKGPKDDPPTPPSSMN